MQNNLSRKVGEGKEVRFWSDLRVRDRRLREQFPRLYRLAANKEDMVSDMGEWEGDVWHWQWSWHKELYQWEQELV